MARVLRCILQEMGILLLGLSDWWRYLLEHIGRNATNYFKYLMGMYKRAPRGLYAEPTPPITPKVHSPPDLNQAGVQHFISNLTDA